jgi:DNA-binding CsgD family transcriptional regulator
MMIESLVPGALAQTMERVDPFLALVDGDGTIHDRRVSRTASMPEDLRSAGSLRSVLSPPVLSEWLRMVRSTIANGHPHAALAVLDGRATEVMSVPHPVRREGVETPAALIGLFQGTLPQASRGPQAPRLPYIPVSLTEHEWGPLESLTRCQLDTLRRVSQGLSNDEIAKAIFRTKRAVEWHIRFLNETLQVHGRERLGMIGREAGLHLFSEEDWKRMLKTRPARRSNGPVSVGPSLLAS